MSYQISLCVFISVISYAYSAKILGIFHFPSVSHQVVFQPIWRELSLRGHEVTVITPNPLNDSKLVNLTEIDVSFSYEAMLNTDFLIKLSKNSEALFAIPLLFEFGVDLLQDQIKYEPVKNLLNDTSTKFDIIIFQNSHIFNLVLGYVAKYRCPAVGISSLGLFLNTFDAVGNPTHPVLSPDMMLKFSGKLSFFNKVESLLFNFWYRMLYYWYALPKADKIARKYFGEDIPYLGDVEKNISLTMMTVNPLIHEVRANVPNVIEINQMHVRTKKTLPQDIRRFLDNSHQGVIYFSLGSNVKSMDLPDKLKEEIIGALKELPYNILWKWEADQFPGKPANVMIRKWLPQQDVLGHPNVKVFVTQGGLQSIEEAIAYGIPMVGIPFITDQPMNVKKIADLKMGLALDPKVLTRQQLKDAIIEVAENKEFKREILIGKEVLEDQPMKGLEKAVWWIEYVIRHNGAKHLRSPAADMSFFEYFMVDVILFLIVTTYVFGYITIKIILLITKTHRNMVEKKNN